MFLFGSAANHPERKTRLQREIDAIDRQLDQLVYELYGLTKDEIQIIDRDGMTSEPIRRSTHEFILKKDRASLSLGG